MLSILIPCFDYNAYPLVCEIDKQALILELKFEIIVVAGIFNHNFEELQKLYEKYSHIKIFRHVNDLSRLMLNSDLFIGAGGTTTWERLYMALPSIVTIISDDQKRVYSPKKAVQFGADFLVIGRPIMNSKDPLKTIRQINTSI